MCSVQPLLGQAISLEPILDLLGVASVSFNTIGTEENAANVPPTYRKYHSRLKSSGLQARLVQLHCMSIPFKRGRGYLLNSEFVDCCLLP